MNNKSNHAMVIPPCSACGGAGVLDKEKEIVCPSCRGKCVEW